MSERVRAARLWTSKRLNCEFRLFVDAEDARFGIRLCSNVMPNRSIARIVDPPAFTHVLVDALLRAVAHAEL